MPALPCFKICGFHRLATSTLISVPQRRLSRTLELRAVGSGISDQMSQIKFMQPAELKASLEDAEQRDKIIILDVRDDDFAGGHLKGCVNIPSYDFQSERIDLFIQERLGEEIHSVVVHCYFSQQRGPLCARRLAVRLAQLERPGKPQISVCVLAHGWRRFQQLFGDTEHCEYDE